jgi:hypothetical protein
MIILPSLQQNVFLLLITRLVLLAHLILLMIEELVVLLNFLLHHGFLGNPGFLQLPSLNSFQDLLSFQFILSFKGHVSLLSNLGLVLSHFGLVSDGGLLERILAFVTGFRGARVGGNAGLGAGSLARSLATCCVMDDAQNSTAKNTSSGGSDVLAHLGELEVFVDCHWFSVSEARMC